MEGMSSFTRSNNNIETEGGRMKQIENTQRERERSRVGDHRHRKSSSDSTHWLNDQFKEAIKSFQCGMQAWTGLCQACPIPAWGRNYS